ncbi:hypothetical protein Val02_84950 [Virgisporangium aliadipatigenens]|uniref:DUF3263 domain-containing protein n=1 Tax=Virgisporangium aliadipatigenens TaxID=741659 RepID=A0A8J4DVA8_9ACTN|nr:hypothetical protein Val02_84950 [Virgisporangium aliadipatigenens]
MTRPADQASTGAVPEARATTDDDFEPAREAKPEPEPAALDERAREILAFERRWWRHAGAKEQAIRDRFQLSATRYYALLNTLLDDPRALAHDPTLVARLRRLRASRTRRP